METLTEIELEAMLLRAHGAWRLRKDGDADFFEALALAVLPSPELLEASMASARASGPGAEARRLSHVIVEKPKRRLPVPRHLRVRRSESLDDALSRL